MNEEVSEPDIGVSKRLFRTHRAYCGETAAAQPDSSEEAPAEPEVVPVSDEIVPDLAARYVSSLLSKRLGQKSRVLPVGIRPLGVANLALLGGLAWWWLGERKGKSESAEDVAAREALDLETGQLDDADLDSDFDNFDGAEEEEIPAAEEKRSASMGGTQMGVLNPQRMQQIQPMKTMTEIRPPGRQKE